MILSSLNHPSVKNNIMPALDMPHHCLKFPSCGTECSPGGYNVWFAFRD